MQAITFPPANHVRKLHIILFLFFHILYCLLILTDEYSEDFEDDILEDEPRSARSDGKEMQRQCISLSLTQIKVRNLFKIRKQACKLTRTYHFYLKTEIFIYLFDRN